MPDTQTDSPSPAGADIGSLISSATPPGLQNRLADIRRDQSAATDKITRDTDSSIDYDQRETHRWREASEASGIEAAKYPKWDADQEREKFRHEPLEAFGSLGSVVGLLASAFVHAPMESAFNASAAAMNAIKAGDDQAYDRAHTAWKENMDLVYKRHDMMRGEYQDATSLMLTDLRAGEAKLKTAAARFGDKRALALSEAGMDKELYEYLDSQNKAVEGLRKINLETMEDTMKAKAYDGIAGGIDQAAKQAQAETGQPPNPAEVAGRKLQAFQRIYKGKTDTPSQELLGMMINEHPEWKSEQLAAEARKQGLLPYANRGGSDAAIIDALNREHEAAGQPPPTAAEIGEAISRGRRGASGSQNLTTDRQRAQDVLAYRNALKEEKNEDGSPKYTPDQIARLAANKESELKSMAAGVTANIANNGKIRLEQIKYSTEAIDKVESLLKKHNALTGLGGRVTRPAETLATVFGSNETDRHEFESLIGELREWGPRIMTNSSGRPLSAEQSNIASVIRGLNMGDTTKITAERLLNYKKLLQEMATDTEKRIKLNPEDRGSVAPPKSEGGEKPWERDRRLQRSALESQDDAA